MRSMHLFAGGGGGLMAAPTRWTHERDAEMAALYRTHSRRGVALAMGLSEAAVNNRMQAIGLAKPPGSTSASGRFPVGQIPWNKGVPFNSGGRSAETQFKPGQKPHTWHPIGHERISKDGIRQRKMTDTGVTRRDYVPVHVLLWRERFGEVPRGCIVIFRNRNREDFRIENLECISRAENMRRNSIHTIYPPQIARLCQLRGAITRQINKRSQSHE